MSKRSRRNLILFLVLGSYTFLMCRCYSDSYVMYSGGWTCQRWYEPGIEMGYVCSQTCPYEGGSSFSEKQVKELSELDSLPKCAVPSGPTATETPGAVESVSLLQIPTETSTPAPILPLLTAEMAGCGEFSDASQPTWWVNLRLAEPHLELDNRNLDITIGGIPSSCGINQSNSSVLTCFASKSVTYPASVVVKLDAVEVNSFTINLSQSFCAPATATKSKGDHESPEATATVAPEEPPVGEGAPQ